MTIKRVRVLVEFDEVNDNYEVVQKRHTGNFKFGSVTSETYGPPERIAMKVGELVTETISTHFPKFLAGETA